MWAAVVTASGKPRRHMTTVMITKIIESPMSAIRGRFQYGRKAGELDAQLTTSP
jgi:hypothetical protein